MPVAAEIAAAEVGLLAFRGAVASVADHPHLLAAAAWDRRHSTGCSPDERSDDFGLQGKKGD